MQLTLSPYTELYNLIVPKDNLLRQINEMVDLSDADVIQRSKYDMFFKYFLEMNTEDSVIDSSSGVFQFNMTTDIHNVLVK